MAIVSRSYLSFQAKKANLGKIFITVILCTLFYLIGLYQDSRGSVPKTPPSSSDTTLVICDQNNHHHQNHTAAVAAATLDFAAHHHLPDPATVVESVRRIPPCDAKYTEYTPCEDVDRSLKFDRDRLIYRERHCPEKAEVLKCRV
ncbi:hypothetical protein Tsubulata_050158, partial [Turnera subulata]